MASVTVGVSLKSYFGNAHAAAWFASAAALAAARPAVGRGDIELFVVPTYLQIGEALTAFAGSRVRVGAQDVSEFGPGAYTGEVTAAELAEVGATCVEIGHAERRRLFGETDDVVARKTALALQHGLTPVVCVGEAERTTFEDAAATVVAQLASALAGAPAGEVIVAYEPVWAIGAREPAPLWHIKAVMAALRRALVEVGGRAGSLLIYGGSAGPGLMTDLKDTVDGVFLGRFAHDLGQLAKVLDEASAVAAERGSL